jgi:hypothetical protein
VICFAGRQALQAWLIYYLFIFWALTHESVSWFGGETQATIKEIADELHAVLAEPARHSRLVKISCFLASTSQLELWFLTLLSKTRRQVHLRSFNNCLTITVHCPPIRACCNYTASKGEA